MDASVPGSRGLTRRTTCARSERRLDAEWDVAGRSTGGTGCGMCRALSTRGPHDLQHGAARDARNGLWRRGLRLKHGAVMGSRTAKEVAQIIGRERCRDRRHHEHQQSHAADAEKRGMAWRHGRIILQQKLTCCDPDWARSGAAEPHRASPHAGS